MLRWFKTLMPVPPTNRALDAAHRQPLVGSHSMDQPRLTPRASIEGAPRGRVELGLDQPVAGNSSSRHSLSIDRVGERHDDLSDSLRSKIDSVLKRYEQTATTDQERANALNRLMHAEALTEADQQTIESGEARFQLKNCRTEVEPGDISEIALNAIKFGTPEAASRFISQMKDFSSQLRLVSFGLGRTLPTDNVDMFTALATIPLHGGSLLNESHMQKAAIHDAIKIFKALSPAFGKRLDWILYPSGDDSLIKRAAGNGSVNVVVHLLEAPDVHGRRQALKAAKAGQESCDDDNKQAAFANTIAALETHLSERPTTKTRNSIRQWPGKLGSEINKELKEIAHIFRTPDKPADSTEPPGDSI